ncbi:acyltransferase family protein [Streptacidiphilus carbonis]|uniref:acyltransferase family protein n=1 Tax=Streptacidiphilus carbonis TaxID=105422 RepID=UPI0005A6E560|nr:acyltransferase [Streptacidiphilus carbonis]
MSWIRSRGTLDRLLVGRANSFGLLRLLLALSVVYAHAYVLGYGSDRGWKPLWALSVSPVDCSTLAVAGFFVLSGFMITSSGTRLSSARFAWHRALRILPGLWASLLVTALVVAPLVHIRLFGSTAGFWSSRSGPLAYLKGSWITAMSSGFDISGVMSAATHRGLVHNPAFEGTLWSLSYEIFCYVVVGILAAGGVLKRAPRTVLLITVGLWSSMLVNFVDAPARASEAREPSAAVAVPLLGGLETHFLVYLGFCFMLGATMRLFQHRIHINGLLALGAAAVLLVTMHYGGFLVFGYPAFAYLLFYLGVRLPSWLHWVGRKHDYSYGAYIYGFLAEQLLTLYGVPKHGMAVYLSLSVAGTLALAFLSWHLVERQALRLKDWTPPRPSALRRGPRPESSGGDGQPVLPGQGVLEGQRL